MILKNSIKINGFNIKGVTETKKNTKKARTKFILYLHHQDKRLFE